MLAEDNETNQLIAKNPFGTGWFWSNHSQEWKGSCEHYKKHRNEIDLILMDLHMPVMNGYEAAEQIREMSAQVPIIALTADVVSRRKREMCTKRYIPLHQQAFSSGTLYSNR